MKPVNIWNTFVELIEKGVNMSLGKDVTELSRWIVVMEVDTPPTYPSIWSNVSLATV